MIPLRRAPDRPSRGRLLVVDDNEDNLEILSFLLSERYTVSAHGSAREALDAMATFRPEVLVLDIGMPAIDGMQLLHAIRTVPGFTDVPAIAVTGFARDVDQKTFLQAGFQAVIVKPILDQVHLLDVIERLLEPIADAAS